MVCGCSRGGETAKPKTEPVPVARVTGDATCEQVAEHSHALMMTAGSDEKLRVRADQIAKIVIRRCNADGWSVELRNCLGSAKTPDATERCEDLATEEQEEALEKETELLEGDD